MECDPPDRPSAVKANAKLFRVYEAGKISLDELFENVLGSTFMADERTWDECIAVIPSSLRPQFFEFVRFYLLSVDFMPPPGVLLPPPAPEMMKAAKEATKRQRRPRYVKLFQLIDEMCSPNDANGDRRTSAIKNAN
ncbi:MAG TPA: hypothetical protein VGN42_03830 [Pirellulales bacterium]|jgi:hypothetical protein|nr:hypothetical protein [Pirellulales bacterium]